MTKRIAMWSGPRNISTAMMRSWENRADCTVVDEPFYAYYLQQTQSPHPLFDDIIKSQSADFNTVANSMSAGACDTALQYQKHMTQHMLAGCDMTWTQNMQHCFLIRDPASVVNSYTNSRGACSANDIGIKRQYELLSQISELTGKPIPVIDTASVLADPKRTMQGVCEALSINFDPNMLAWSTGRRSSDGVWASHWYHSVEASTGFGSAKQVEFTLTDPQQEVVEEVMPYYIKMKAMAL